MNPVLHSVFASQTLPRRHDISIRQKPSMFITWRSGASFFGAVQRPVRADDVGRNREALLSQKMR
jgi:hypothetical protein